MPYIKKQYREIIEQGETPKNVGELNYCISQLLLGYLKDRGLHYQSINDIMGAMEGAKAEFYRRVAVPYENEKMILNGDIYDEAQTFILRG